MHDGTSAVWVDEVAVGLAVCFKAVAVVPTGGDAEIIQREGLQSIAMCGFGGLNANTPRCAFGRMADGSDLSTNF